MNTSGDRQGNGYAPRSTRAERRRQARAEHKRSYITDIQILSRLRAEFECWDCAIPAIPVSYQAWELEPKVSNRSSWYVIHLPDEGGWVCKGADNSLHGTFSESVVAGQPIHPTIKTAARHSCPTYGELAQGFDGLRDLPEPCHHIIGLRRALREAA